MVSINCSCLRMLYAESIACGTLVTVSWMRELLSEVTLLWPVPFPFWICVEKFRDQSIFHKFFSSFIEWVNFGF